MTKAWQRGIELVTLQRHAELYRSRHKPLVFGAFGLVKERDIATAIAEKCLLFARGATEGSVAASAIARRLRAGSTHRDFCGRELRLYAGAIFASAFACADATAGERLLAAMIRRAPGAPVYVEAFEEDATARAALEAAGFRYCMTKIAAGSEVKGMYSAMGDGLAELPPAESAALEICRPGFADPGDIAQALAEIRRYESSHDMWAQHYSSYNKRKSWTAIALHGYDPLDPSFIIAPREMSQQWKADNPARLIAKCAPTIAAGAFPAAMRLVDRLPGRKDRVRFMRLAAEGELTRHADITDRLAGTANGRLTRLHIPLVTNPGAIFRAWGIRGELIERHLPAGALCFLDQRKPHAVVNRSPAERIHIVADVESSPELRALLFSAE